MVWGKFLAKLGLIGPVSLDLSPTVEGKFLLRLITFCLRIILRNVLHILNGKS